MYLVAHNEGDFVYSDFSPQLYKCVGIVALWVTTALDHAIYTNWRWVALLFTGKLNSSGPIRVRLYDEIQLVQDRSRDVLSRMWNW